MKIDSVEIKKYKSIIDPIKVDIDNLNILVGPNNAGKTNILDALELFFNSEKDDLKREDAEIKLQISEGQTKKTLTYSSGEINFNGSMEGLIRIGDSLPLEEIATEKLKSLKDDYPDEYKKFSATLEKYFKDVHISEDLFKSNVQTDIGRKPLKRMGDGFKRLFVILFYLYNPKYKIILINEPELHLHPSVIKKFLKILTSNETEKQVIMTTHHPTFVQAKLLPETWRVVRNENHSTIVCKFNREKMNTERFAQEINDDNSAMLFADKALLVEGVSDSILMRNLIDKFYDGTGDIKVVYSGGIGDIDLYEKICKIFNIPYLVMIDGDGLEGFWKKRYGEKPISEKEKREILKKDSIFVLKGSLEENYPKKYQNKTTKPLNALLAGNLITEKDFQSEEMSGLREIIENL